MLLGRIPIRYHSLMPRALRVKDRPILTVASISDTIGAIRHVFHCHLLIRLPISRRLFWPAVNPVHAQTPISRRPSWSAVDPVHPFRQLKEPLAFDGSPCNPFASLQSFPVHSQCLLCIAKKLVIDYELVSTFPLSLQGMYLRKSWMFSPQSIACGWKLISQAWECVLTWSIENHLLLNTDISA